MTAQDQSKALLTPLQGGEENSSSCTESGISPAAPARTETRCPAGGFTPGPWTLDRGPVPTERLDGHSWINGEAWVGLAQIPTEYAEGGGIAEGLANACLISAAPDLLEALKTAVALLDIWKGWTPSYCQAHLDFESLPEVIAARAAIAKATGRKDPK